LRAEELRRDAEVDGLVGEVAAELPRLLAAGLGQGYGDGRVAVRPPDE
jgi:hypothetical protein